METSWPVSIPPTTGFSAEVISMGLASRPPSHRTHITNSRERPFSDLCGTVDDSKVPVSTQKTGLHPGLPLPARYPTHNRSEIEQVIQIPARPPASQDKDRILRSQPPSDCLESPACPEFPDSQDFPAMLKPQTGNSVRRRAGPRSDKPSPGIPCRYAHPEAQDYQQMPHLRAESERPDT